MSLLSLHNWKVETDVAINKQIYDQLHSLDPSCCGVCATFQLFINEGAFPREVLAFLIAAGADPLKPKEVSGAPDSGVLEGAWLLVGTLLEGKWRGGAEHAFVEPQPGFKYWIGEDSTFGIPDPLFDGHKLIHLEFAWDNRGQSPQFPNYSN